MFWFFSIYVLGTGYLEWKYESDWTKSVLNGLSSAEDLVQSLSFSV